MLQQKFRLLRTGFLPILIVLGMAVLGGCGGTDEVPTGSLTDPDIALGSLVVDGYDIGFSPAKTGPYNIQVPNSVTTLTLTPTANREGLVIDTYYSSTLHAVSSTEAEVIQSGSSHQYTLAEGTTLITIRLRDNEALLLTNYTIKVNRVSTTAALAGVVFGNLLATASDSPYFTLSPTFAVGTFNYSVSVPYANCTSFVVPYTNNASTQLSVTAPGRTIDPARSSDAIYFDLQTGANQVTTNLVSEDGLNTAAYNFTVTRAAGTTAEIAANANLASLSLNPGEFTFFCGVSTYPTIVVNSNVDVVEIVAQPENSAATIEINEEAYVNGEIFNLTLEDEEATEIEIVVTAADDQATRTYTLAVVRSPRNITTVDTAEELQAALLNAQPNDEIRVAPGTYTGVASLATSGSDTAHFYSAQSGTAEQPIYLTAQSFFADSVLSGADSALNTVLELTGDHWVVLGLKIENARNGIVLDSANNNAVRTVEFRNTGAQALVIRNGSSNNQVSSSRFGHTGVGIDTSETGNAEAILIGSDSAQWQSNPNTPGPWVETDNNNAIRSSFFASSIASEAIEVNEGAVGTIIEFNTFESGSLTGMADDTSLLKVQGNETSIRYNSFYHVNDVNLQEVIAVDDASETWHAQDWGEDTRIYQNEFLLSGANVPAVRANSVATYVAENTREEGGNLNYTGSGIDQTFTVPFYQFRMSSNQNLCVSTGDFAVTAETSVAVAESATCADGNLAMQWKLLNDGDGYVRIQSAADPALYFYPVSSFINGCSATARSQSLIRVNAPAVEGMIYSWRILYRDEDASFFNKSNENFQMSALSDEDGVLQADSPVVMCQATNHSFQNFRLVEQ